ncbi:hypothetical protein NKJ26_28985 [Mesorhizobium sp. M0152]|uniref:hypothetical protein n=1 Tax=Mesorhizobium sp. M0152 TaxID=2956898 RepID=UPI00333D2CC9
MERPNLGDRWLRLALDLARQLMGAPRHLSQHPGGFVLTHDRLDDLVPIEPAAMAETPARCGKTGVHLLEGPDSDHEGRPWPGVCRASAP